MNDRFKDPKIVAVIGIVTSLAGFGAGYLLGKRQKKFVHAVPAQDWSLAPPTPSVDGVTKEYIDNLDNIHVKEEFNPGKTFIQEAFDRGIENITEDEEVEPIRQNIFVDSDWNYEEEASKRNEENPYVLHRDEFYGEEKGYSQTTLTYYAGDDILVDEEDKPIYNHSTIIGPLLFGHGSGDPTVFYVRSDKLRAEYEVLKDEGLFSVEVLGLEIEENARTTDIQHSADRKFRQD